MFGEVFKKLRKSKHITLGAISKDVISTSQLSRWENGLSDISLNKLIILLNRINVSPQEFIAMTIPKNNETNNFLKNLSLLYSEKDSISIYRIFLKNIAAYHHTNNVDYLFHASAAANVLFDIKNKNYLTPQDQQDLKLFLTQNNHWNLSTIQAFGNSGFILPNNTVFQLINSLIEDIVYLENINFEFYLEAWNTIINNSLILVKTDFKKSKLLLARIKELSYTEPYLSITVKVNFLELLIHYIEDGNSEPIKRFLESAKVLGIPNLYNDLLFGWALLKLNS